MSEYHVCQGNRYSNLLTSKVVDQCQIIGVTEECFNFFQVRHYFFIILFVVILKI